MLKVERVPSPLSAIEAERIVKGKVTTFNTY